MNPSWSIVPSPGPASAALYAFEVERVFTKGNVAIKHAKYFVPTGIPRIYEEMHAKDVFSTRNPSEVKSRHLSSIQWQECDKHKPERRDGAAVCFAH
jgi:hypothetical protein